MSAQITPEDIRASLRDTVTGDDEVVVLFSGIWMFGSLLDMPVLDMPAYLIDVIRDTLGPERTLLFPTYTYAYCSSRCYDMVRSKPETGVLPAHCLSRDEFVRTENPINSYAVTGPRTAELLSITEETQWGDASIMGWLEAVNARACVLGEPWHESCTIFHRAEEKIAVPYRYFKSFPGELCVDGILQRQITAKLYVRPLRVVMDRDYTQIAPAMERQNQILRGPHPDLPLESALTQDIVNTCMGLLSADVFAYVQNKDEIARWIETEKDEEIGSCRIDP